MKYSLKVTPQAQQDLRSIWQLNSQIPQPALAGFRR
jgi:hypothetical protein